LRPDSNALLVTRCWRWCEIWQDAGRLQAKRHIPGLRTKFDERERPVTPVL